MSTPLLGHLDPAFIAIMEEISEQLRALFRTRNHLTLAVSGTGSAGMEAALVNLIEPGDPVLVGINGIFGERMAAVVQRCGGKTLRVEAPWGHIIEADAVETALRHSGPAKAVALVHAETSTGAHQPLAPIGDICRRHSALFVVDAVTSLGGLPVDVDEWGIDVCYSATQKCLSCPPGLAPLTVSGRALQVIRSRKNAGQSWYFDLSLIADYWADAKRAYHHTAPISMLYALREALRLIHEEGLEARFARHRLHSDAVMAGLTALGLQPFAQEGHRLSMLNCVMLPSGIEDRLVRSRLLEEYGIEIGGGLGPLRDKVWRIGLMGESSTQAAVWSLLGALEEIFLAKGWIERPGLALEAAAQAYRRANAPVKSQQEGPA